MEVFVLLRHINLGCGCCECDVGRGYTKLGRRTCRVSTRLELSRHLAHECGYMLNILGVLHFHDGLIVVLGEECVLMVCAAMVVHSGLVMRTKLR